MLVFTPGNYFIEVRDELGFENPNPARYPIRLIPDKYPEAEILNPLEDLEVAGNETIPIVYSARDDFGVSTVKMNFQTSGREKTLTLKSSASQRSIGPETFKWDLAGLALAPGERVSYRLEAGDNDSVSGPKFSSSRTLHLYVRDDRSRAAKEGEEAQQLADALLDLLADQLEELKDPDFFRQRMEEILERLDQKLTQRENRPDRFDLEALRKNLNSLKTRLPEEPKENVTREMERLALLAEDMAKKARMNELEAMARELKNRQRRLLDSLNDLKSRFDQKELEAVLKELKQLEELLRQVMEAMTKLANRLPEEFVNSPDLQGMDFQDLFQDLEEIRKKLMAGDLAGALEAAQRLMQALTQMMASLGKAGSQANMGGMDRMQGEMNRQAGELGKILEEQQEVLKETEGIEREVRRRMEEEIRKRLERELPHLRRQLEELARALPPAQNEMIEELSRLLKDEKMKMFSQRAEELEKGLEGRPADQKRLRELQGDGGSALSRPRKNPVRQRQRELPRPRLPRKNAPGADAEPEGKVRDAVPALSGDGFGNPEGPAGCRQSHGRCFREAYRAGRPGGDPAGAGGDPGSCEIPTGHAADGPADGQADAGHALRLPLGVRPAAGVVLRTLGSHADPPPAADQPAHREGVHRTRPRGV